MLIRAALTVALSAVPALSQPAASVMLDRVTEETVAQQREATGQIVSLRRAAIATQEPGLIVLMDLEPGDAVKRGDPVAGLDDERARLDLARWDARIAADEAVIERRRAEFDQSERDLARYKRLAELGSVGESELDDAQTLVQSRRAALAESEALLLTERAERAAAARTLTDMTIRAPFDGRVVAKHTELGQWVSVGDPIVTLVSLDELEARADIPERSVALLSGPGSPIELSIPALGERVMGELIEIVPQADSLSRLFPIRVRVRDARLRPGMSLTAMVPTGERAPALTISEDAILRNTAGEFVYFDAGGAAQVAPIVRLFSTGGRIAVRSPALRPGVLVVVEGNERMFPTQPLNVLNASEFPEVERRQNAAASQGFSGEGAPGGEG